MRRTTSLLATGATMAAVAAAGLSAAAPAQAAGCTPIEGGSAYLRSFGDDNTYVIAPGGTFDAGTTSPWTTSNASITTGGAPMNVTGSGSGAISIGWTGKITSPTICVKWSDDRLRFFYKAPRGTSFKVTTTAQSDIGSGTVNTWVTSNSSDWQLTPAILIPDWTDSSGTERLKVTISNPIGSRIQVDDVLIDPWKYTRW